MVSRGGQHPRPLELVAGRRLVVVTASLGCDYAWFTSRVCAAPGSVTLSPSSCPAWFGDGDGDEARVRGLAEAVRRRATGATDTVVVLGIDLVVAGLERPAAAALLLVELLAGVAPRLVVAAHDDVPDVRPAVVALLHRADRAVQISPLATGRPTRAADGTVRVDGARPQRYKA